MKKYLPSYSLLLLFILIASCQGQNTTNLPKASVSEPQTLAAPPEISAPDSDPTFMESKVVTTSYGPRNITRDVMQDRNGNLWFASWEGIIRYDGQSFTNFTNKEGLRRFHVFSVLEEETGNLWFGTIGAGVYRYDGTSFRNFTTKDGLAENKVLCMLEDKSGNIWFGTGNGVSRYSGASFRNFTKAEGLADNTVNAMIADRTGNIWFGTSSGVCFYDGRSFTNFKNQGGLPFNNVRAIIEDKNGHLWFGGDHGLCRYDGKSFTKFIPNFVGYIFEDKKGDIWISAGGTHNMVLYHYDGKSLSSGQAGFTQITKREGQIFGIVEDQHGDLWFGTEQGVCRYDGKSFNYFTGQGPQQ